MFSVKEKQMIAQKVEKLLLSLNHPEMPSDKPNFFLHVRGKEDWSWADIDPNWKYKTKSTSVNPWNEQARKVMK